MLYLGSHMLNVMHYACTIYHTFGILRMYGHRDVVTCNFRADFMVLQAAVRSLLDPTPQPKLPNSKLENPRFCLT